MIRRALPIALCTGVLIVAGAATGRAQAPAPRPDPTRAAPTTGKGAAPTPSRTAPPTKRPAPPRAAPPAAKVRTAAPGAGTVKPERPAPRRPTPRKKDDDDEDDDAFAKAKVVKVKKVKRKSTSNWHPDAWADPKATARLERVINLRLARTARRLTFLVTVDHRTSSAAFTRNTFSNLFGFDEGNLKIGIGLRFGILDNLDVGFLRLNGVLESFDVYELDVRYHFLQQKKHYLDMGVVAGVTWFYHEGERDAVGGYGQLILHRTFFRRLTIGTSLLFHSDSSSDIKSVDDKNFSLAMGFFVQLRLSKLMVWTAETAVSVAGYGRACMSPDAERRCYPVFSSSLKFVTNRHTFSLVLSNTQYYSADGIVANSSRSYKDMVVGFLITREIHLK